MQAWSWVRKIPWRWKWQPTAVFSPEESYGQRSLAGHNPEGRKESDMTEHAHMRAKMISYQGSRDKWGFIIALGTSCSSYWPSLRAFGIPNPLRISSVLASFWQTSGSLPSDVCPGAINTAFLWPSHWNSYLPCSPPPSILCIFIALNTTWYFTYKQT